MKSLLLLVAVLFPAAPRVGLFGRNKTIGRQKDEPDNIACD